MSTLATLIEIVYGPILKVLAPFLKKKSEASLLWSLSRLLFQESREVFISDELIKRNL